jgi:hypothetical protein
MVEFSSMVMIALICSMLGFGIICWVFEFCASRCYQIKYGEDDDNDIFVPMTFKTPIVTKSASSSY